MRMNDISESDASRDDRPASSADSEAVAAPSPPGEPTANPPAVKSRSLLRRVRSRWRQFLLLWLLLAAPIFVLAYLLNAPVYEASSLLRIEPPTPDVFGPLNRGMSEEHNSAYLMTQVGLIKSARVLEPAVADPLVVKLLTIRSSRDPETDLRERLKVSIVDNTNLIRVALELRNPAEAVTIVKAVVQAYLMQNTDYNRSANRDLMKALEQRLLQLREQIELNRAKLKELQNRAKAADPRAQDRLNPKSETDPTQPTFWTLKAEHVAKWIDRMVQCDLEYIDAACHLEATRLVRQQNLGATNKELDARVRAEFMKDPAVAALREQIDQRRRQAHFGEQPTPPAALAARRELEKLTQEYDDLWSSTSPAIRIRLAHADTGVLSDAKIQELEVAVEKARRMKEALAQQFDKITVETALKNAGDLEIDYLNRQINSLLNWEEQVKKNLEQLRFEAQQDRYRVVLVDPASAPKVPSNNHRLKYTMAAPAVVFILLLAVFFAQEIMAGRKGAAASAG